MFSANDLQHHDPLCTCRTRMKIKLLSANLVIVMVMVVITVLVLVLGTVVVSMESLMTYLHRSVK